MKKISYSMIIVLLSILLFSCRKGGTWGIKGEGDNVSQIKEITGFDGIDLATDAEINYTQDGGYYVEITAQKNILSVLDIKVENGDLHIGTRRELWKHNKVIITVHAPVIRRMNISGSGDINSLSTLDSDDLRFTISGSGDINVPTIVTKTAVAKISGSGRININNGTADTENYSMSGSGNINTEYVNAKTCSISMSGSGNVRLTATDRLSISLSGSGDINYHGKPVVTVDMSGSGRVSSLD
jgi:hypothetical protein